MINLPDLKTAQINGKKVFLRADLDIPIENGIIQDDTRLEEGIETLNFLLGKGAHVIIAGHLGRPEGKEEKFSLKPVADYLAKKLNSSVKEGRVGEFEGWQITPELYLLENLRFYPEEEASDPVFSQKLASLADVYVNDSFATVHRAHSSIVGIAGLIPHYAGFMLKKEVEVLSNLLENPKRPLTVIIGGAKIETKLPLVEKMHKIADYVLVGGKIAQETKVLLKVQHEKIEGRKSALMVADLNPQMSDITSNDAENFLQIINMSQTIIWNGPIGITEGLEENHEISSFKLAYGIANSGIYSVVGGGDTVGYLKKIGLLGKFSFVSTGGGAMLELLYGEKLPGIEVLGSV